MGKLDVCPDPRCYPQIWRGCQLTLDRRWPRASPSAAMLRQPGERSGNFGWLGWPTSDGPYSHMPPLGLGEQLRSFVKVPYERPAVRFCSTSFLSF